MRRQNPQEILREFSRKMDDIIFSSARVIDANIPAVEIGENGVRVAPLHDQYLHQVNERGRTNVVQMAVESIISDPEYNAVFSQNNDEGDVENSPRYDVLKKQERNLAIAMILPVEYQIFDGPEIKRGNWFKLLHDLAQQYYEYEGRMNIHAITADDGSTGLLARTLQTMALKVVEALDKNTDILFHCSDITLRNLDMLLQSPLFDDVREAAERVRNAMPNYRPLEEQLGSIEGRVRDITQELDGQDVGYDQERSYLFRRSDFTKLVNDISIAYRNLLLQAEEYNVDLASREFTDPFGRIQGAASGVRRLYSVFGLFGAGVKRGRCPQQLFLEFSENLIRSAPQDINIKSLFISDPHVGWDDVVDDQGFLVRLDALRQFEKERVAEISEMLSQGVTPEDPQLKAHLLALHHYTALAIEELYAYTIDFQSTPINPLTIREIQVCINYRVSNENREIALKAFSSLETCLERTLPNEILNFNVRKFNELNQIIPDNNQNWGRYEAEAPQREAEADAERKASDIAYYKGIKAQSAAAAEHLRKLREEGEKLDAEYNKSFNAKFDKLMRAIAWPFVWLFNALAKLVQRLFGKSVAEDSPRNGEEGLDASVKTGFADKTKTVDVLPVVTPSTDTKLEAASAKVRSADADDAANPSVTVRPAPGKGNAE